MWGHNRDPFKLIWSLSWECKEQELTLLLLFFHCSRTLLRSNTPPLKQMQKMNAEEIILSKHVNSCNVTRHLGSSLVPEQSQRQHVHSQSLSILLTPEKVPRALTTSTSPDFIPWLCWSPDFFLCTALLKEKQLAVASCKILSFANEKTGQVTTPFLSHNCWKNRYLSTSYSFSSGLSQPLPFHTSTWVYQCPSTF